MDHLAAKEADISPRSIISQKYWHDINRMAWNENPNKIEWRPLWWLDVYCGIANFSPHFFSASIGHETW